MVQMYIIEMIFTQKIDVKNSPVKSNTFDYQLNLKLPDGERLTFSVQPFTCTSHTPQKQSKFCFIF